LEKEIPEQHQVPSESDPWRNATEREARDREGYQHSPAGTDDSTVWEGVASWPEE
jgi:hypothetical protein